MKKNAFGGFGRLKAFFFCTEPASAGYYELVENVACSVLLRRGCDGSVGNAAADVIATTSDKAYIQATESMQSELVRSRELAPLMKIQDKCE